MNVDPTQRLGAKGHKYVSDHPFFDSINWKLIKRKKLKPPYTPRAQNFNKNNSKEYIPTHEKGAFNNKLVHNFTYVENREP